ncbi:energy transducer TonB family protein [Rhodoplanes azumiensis]|uniref:Energy transducer TonB n=1 Tax=Rhodoplanes azumiensis TaxID=1897628 RepID=A0ABW5AEY7_9BRAD
MDFTADRDPPTTEPAADSLPAGMAGLTAERAAPAVSVGGDVAHWRTAVLLALGLHAAVAGALLARPASPPPDPDGGAPVVVIELAVVAAAPETPPADLAPAPVAEAAPEPPPPPLEAAPPEPVVDEPPPPTEPSPERSPEPPKPADPDGIPEPTPPLPPPKAAEPLPVAEPPVAAAPPAAATPAPKPATAAPGVVAQAPPAVMARWQTLLLAELHRKKRYPGAARGRTGTARVAFTIDRDGHVLTRSIATSSGSAVLDAEALALLDRVSPLPAPPPELAEAALSFVVPVRFTKSAAAR